MKDLRELKISTIKGFITDFAWEYKTYLPSGVNYGRTFPTHAWAEQLMQDLEQRDMDDMNEFMELNVSTQPNVR